MSVDILLVEDNPLDTKATLNAAKKLDITESIRTVADGQRALDYLRTPSETSQIPTLVLLDLNLPGKDGHDVLREIRSDPALSAIPVVILTSSVAEADIQSAYSSGANAYVQKPSGLDDWVSVLSTINDFWLSVAELPGRFSLE